VLQASVLGSALPATVRKGGIDPLEGLEIRTGTLDLAVQPAARARSAPEVGRVDVRVVAPGRPVEYFKADVLFIHAHPDDESIDFATLMAKASRSGKRTATLLFTDGESGLDLYPQRMVGDIYPARKLEGASLSQVRVVEATRALSILGSEMYVRWGLENRPYNTRRDEVPPAEVIRGWGGEEQLVERLIAVLEGFRPTIVVSPDGPSRAHEHFEHEAVGQLVYGALERLRRSGKSFVKAYLVSVDPYQAGRYEGLTALDAGSRESGSELDYKAIQTLALKEHVTQRDASVIGVSRLSHLSQEFYKVVFWELDESLEEYLK
jgi:LmbE family N-acetylglucosaminyl deacetylase